MSLIRFVRYRFFFSFFYGFSKSRNLRRALTIMSRAFFFLSCKDLHINKLSPRRSMIISISRFSFTCLQIQLVNKLLELLDMKAFKRNVKYHVYKNFDAFVQNKQRETISLGDSFLPSTNTFVVSRAWIYFSPSLSLDYVRVPCRYLGCNMRSLSAQLVLQSHY